MIGIPKTRLEAFSDGVVAIIITIMVLELKVPHGTDIAALKPLFPSFLSYVLSFVYVGIYWNNHHHMFHAVKHINGKIMWANLHLLFRLSLIPFVTGWMGEYHGSPWPSAFYGTVLFMAGLAYAVLQNLIVVSHGKDSLPAKAFEKTWKEKISLICYAAAIGLSFMNPYVSGLLYMTVALVWLIPDSRIEKLTE